MTIMALAVSKPVDQPQQVRFGQRHPDSRSTAPMRAPFFDCLDYLCVDLLALCQSIRKSDAVNWVSGRFDNARESVHFYSFVGLSDFWGPFLPRYKAALMIVSRNPASNFLHQ